MSHHLLFFLIYLISPSRPTIIIILLRHRLSNTNERSLSYLPRHRNLFLLRLLHTNLFNLLNNLLHRWIILLRRHRTILLNLCIILSNICFVISSPTIIFFLEMWEKVCPHYVCLIDVGALGLGHLDEVVDEELAVVFANSPCLIEALIWIKW